jgi:hypothetical protein
METKMGLTLSVTFPASPPAWADVARLLAERGYPVQMRMIDGQLAFPDETPTEPWRELRVATPGGGMITIQRGADRVALVVWGNADGALRQGWHALAWAFTQVGQGTVEGAADLDLPDALRS